MVINSHNGNFVYLVVVVAVLSIAIEPRSGKLIDPMYSRLPTSVNNLVVFSSMGLWCPLLDLFKDYPVLRDVVLKAYGANQFVETINVSDADVVFVAYGVGHRAFINDLVSGDNAITIYIQCENFEITEFSHQFKDSVDVSLGSSFVLSASNYQYTPCWLVTALSRDANYPLRFSPDLLDTVEPEVWRSRSRYAAQISNHGSFPRRLLVDSLSQVGLVEQFGKWRTTNSDWPSYLLPRYPSNVYFFRHFRYVICPESQRSPSGGYITEKIVMAHLSGAIPVFWGDEPTSQVFNPDRILTLNAQGPDDPNLSQAVQDLLQKVRLLENNATFRKEWFMRPILKESALLWVESWISNVTRLIERARSLRLSHNYRRE